MAEITVYGAPWCPDCKRSKKFLAEHRVPFNWVDIDDDPEGLRFVEQLQKGGRTIPTILFPEGTICWDRWTGTWPGASDSSWRRIAPPMTSPSSEAGRRGSPPPSTRHARGSAP
jgi:glutaredoxin